MNRFLRVFSSRKTLITLSTVLKIDNAVVMVQPKTLIQSNAKNHLKRAASRLFSSSSSVTGYFIWAGCCFSKQEEGLLTSDPDCYSTGLINDPVTHVPDSETQTDLSRMKRNVDHIIEPVSKVHETEVESRTTPEPPVNKKAKTDEDSLILNSGTVNETVVKSWTTPGPSVSKKAKTEDGSLFLNSGTVNETVVKSWTTPGPSVSKKAKTEEGPLILNAGTVNETEVESWTTPGPSVSKKAKTEEGPLILNAGTVNETDVESWTSPEPPVSKKAKTEECSLILASGIVNETQVESRTTPEPSVSKKAKTEEGSMILASGTVEEKSYVKNKDNLIDDASLMTNEPKDLQKRRKKEKKSVLSCEPIGSKNKDCLKKEEKPVKQRPNYFVAVQISDDQIRQSLKLVQDHILEQEKALLKSMTSLKTLHITLLVMHIADQESYDKAFTALQSVHDEFDCDFSQNPLQIEFQGLGHFKNRVLYAKISNDEATNRLTFLAEGVRKHFSNASLITEDERFTPHMTVAKIDFKQNRKGVKKIDPLLYEKFINEYFGTQVVESVQLCKMTGPKNEEGYYSNEEVFFTRFSPIEHLNDLKKSLAIENQKKDVREMINNLMKEKLK